MTAEHMPEYPVGPIRDADDRPTRPADLVSQERRLLLGNVAFLIFLFGGLQFWCWGILWLTVHLPDYHIFAFFGIGLLAIPLLLLGARLIRWQWRKPPDESLMIDLEDHPRLHSFLDRVAEDLEAQDQEAIRVSSGISIQSQYQLTGLTNLFMAPRRELEIGFGLLNLLNLSEFQAVVAREYSVSAPRSTPRDYLFGLVRLNEEIISGSASLNRNCEALTQVPFVRQVLGLPLLGANQVMGWCLSKLYRICCWSSAEWKRNLILHADRSAASVAGSDAATHVMFQESLAVEVRKLVEADLSLATERKLHTADLFFHQKPAIEKARLRPDQSEFGHLPTLPPETGGERVQIFEPTPESDDTTTPVPGLTHYDREESLKLDFLYAPIDERSPWLLFQNASELRTQITRLHYQQRNGISKRAPLTDPRTIQQLIDQQYRQMTYDARYLGCYDSRLIQPGNLRELTDMIRREPWDEARLVSVYQKLYGDVAERARQRLAILKDYDNLLAPDSPVPARRLRRLLKDLESDLANSEEQFGPLDRRVYLVHGQMAIRTNPAVYQDFLQRYQDHLAIQTLFRVLRSHDRKCQVLHAIVHRTRATREEYLDLLDAFHDAHTAMKKQLRTARELSPSPEFALENCDCLADYLLEEKLIREIPRTFIRGAWLDQFLGQLSHMHLRAKRLHAISLGVILQLQDQIANSYFVSQSLTSPPPEPPLANSSEGD